jgi:hypothetical protein
MGFHRKWFSWKAVRNDEGYEVGFVGTYKGGRRVKYSIGDRALTVLAEPAKVEVGTNTWRLGLHFALDDRYLAKWDDGSPTTAEERASIRGRIHAALEYMGVLHSTSDDTPRG